MMKPSGGILYIEFIVIVGPTTNVQMTGFEVDKKHKQCFAYKKSQLMTQLDRPTDFFLSPE